MIDASSALTCPGDTVLLTADVARLMRVSTETVRDWHRAGRLPATRTLSGVRLFLARDVAQFQMVRGGVVEPVTAA